MRSRRGNTVVNTAPQDRASAIQRHHLMREVIEVLIFVALVFGIVHFALAVRTTVDTKMSPALKEGDWVAVNQWAYVLGAPGRGDVVLMRDPHNTQNVLIRRVIALPGDTVALTATTVSINGVVLTEPYANVPKDVPANPVVGSCTVSSGAYYVMGDSRNEADDSRQFGAVPSPDILGRAVAVYWPASSLKLISSFSPVFDQVPSSYPKTNTPCGGNGL